MSSHMLADDTDYDEFGADYFDRRIHTTAQTRRLVAQLQRLSHTVILTPAT